MVNEINYISINELASRILDNTLLSDVNIEQIIRHVLDFMAKFGVNNIYKDKTNNKNKCLQAGCARARWCSTGGVGVA